MNRLSRVKSLFQNKKSFFGRQVFEVVEIIDLNKKSRLFLSFSTKIRQKNKRIIKTPLFDDDDDDDFIHFLEKDLRETHAGVDDSDDEDDADDDG